MHFLSKHAAPAVVLAMLSSCSGIATPPFWVQANQFMYLGDQLTVQDTKPLAQNQLALKITSQRTGGVHIANVTVTPGATVGVTLSASILPDLSPDVSQVDQFKVEATQGGETIGTQFAVIQDRQALLPPAVRIAVFPPPAFPGGNRPQPVADQAALDSAAMDVAVAWGGQNLVATSSEIPASAVSQTAGATAYKVRQYDFRGKYLKHVVPAELSGATADVIAVPGDVEVFMVEASPTAVVKVRVPQEDFEN